MSKLIKQWDDAAELFAQNQEGKEADLAESNKRVVKARFQQFSGEKVLDLGCGYGYYTEYFHSIGAQVFGIDGSEQMVRLARERCPSAEFAVRDITRPLPYEDGAFELVFCNQVLMDIEDVEPVFSECARVLKPGGTFYYSIVHPAFYDGWWVKNESGYKYAKAVERYISEYDFANHFWGETRHFHRPLSVYLNLAAKHGLVLKAAEEPAAYDGITKTADIPLFFFAEYVKR